MGQFAGKVAIALCGEKDEELLVQVGDTRVFSLYDDAADFAADEIADDRLPQQ